MITKEQRDAIELAESLPKPQRKRNKFVDSLAARINRAAIYQMCRQIMHAQPKRRSRP